MSDELKISLYHCEITKQPCGTDTWRVEQPCPCLPCRVYCLEEKVAALEQWREEARELLKEKA